jgi:hypothetical protein
MTAQLKISLFFNGTYFANVEVLGVITKPAQVSSQLGCSKCLSLCRQTNLESKEHRFNKPRGFKLLVQLSYFLAYTVQVILLPDEKILKKSYLQILNTGRMTLKWLIPNYPFATCCRFP